MFNLTYIFPIDLIDHLLFLLYFLPCTIQRKRIFQGYASLLATFYYYTSFKQTLCFTQKFRAVLGKHNCYAARRYQEFCRVTVTYLFSTKCFSIFECLNIFLPA